MRVQILLLLRFLFLKVRHKVACNLEPKFYILTKYQSCGYKHCRNCVHGTVPWFSYFDELCIFWLTFLKYLYHEDYLIFCSVKYLRLKWFSQKLKVDIFFL